MEPASKESKIARVKSDWVEDAVNLQGSSLRSKRIAVALTVASCGLYALLYLLVSQYREQVADYVQDLPIFIRIALNIAQPFLVVFIITSVSLLVLLILRIKKPWLSHKALLILMGSNCVFAAILLAVSVIKI